MADEPKCIKCTHTRRAHSRVGCIEYIDLVTGKECPCKVKFTDAHMFK